MKRDIFSEPLEDFEALATKRLTAAKPCSRRIGAMKAKLVRPEDFDAPLPDDIPEDCESAQE
jgi:hypothetical protein